jgi:hypothetical protein
MVRSRVLRRLLMVRSFGGVSYYGLCDLGSATYVIYNTCYHEILEDIEQSVIFNTGINYSNGG